MLTNRYHALRNSRLGVRLARSPLGARILQSPLSARVTRYTLGSIVAAATSAIVFAILYVMGVGTTACSVVAFIAGAIPNWILNRRWAWRVQGRIAFGREIVAYVIVSALTLFITAETTAWTQRHVQSIPAHHGIRVLLVTASYLAVFAVLFAARFAVYEVWIFSGRSRVRAAFRSRIQVRNAARANRTP
ncbi:MAG: GtrA family protein [Solirubrobacterales bacterium]|nr:GtrA family protein [Solirubrobacterales bacterium]MBV9940628.1 GtrA family protein [Solirubrobacterales bacterium]